MKRYMFPAIVVVLVVLFYLWTPGTTDQGPEIFMEKDGQLLIPQHNVAIVVLDLEEAGLRFTRASDIVRLRELQDELALLGGVSKIESILNASRVISEADDIIVSRAVPADDARVTDRYLRQLALELHDYPELTPFVNQELDTLLFYIYYGNRTPTIDIYRDLTALQNRWDSTIPFEFTGRAPIMAETESLLTGDVLLFMPILAVMVILVFSLFRSVWALGMSMVLIILSMVMSYSFVRFLGVTDSPLVLLIPVFSLGLLSDYLLHYFYHCFHTRAEAGGKSLKKSLLFPLSLTALSTITGFLSLSLINGSGHLQIGFIISAAVLITWVGVFFWIDYWDFPMPSKPLLSGFMHMQGRLFGRIAGYRYIFFALIVTALVWGGIQLSNLTIEPYPIGQLPHTTTIRKADTRINEEFYGTLPFFLEIDTGKKQGLLNKEAMIVLDDVHKTMEEAGTGYAFSVLTVLKRMNYYFMGDEESLLSSTEFDDFYDALIEQYLLYYSSSVDPLEYSSLLDNSYRFFSIKGLLYYDSYDDLDDFIALTGEIQGSFPEGWTMSMYGMARQLETEHNNLRNNWLLSFLSGSIMIFVTVLFFYRRLGLALISLVPGVISMIVSFGFISMAGISLDAFSIIFVAIVTGLVIDYSIHTLVALDQIEEVKSLEEGFRAVIGYSGIPIFLSFMTSTVSFSVLFLSSFRGARSLGFLLLTSLVLSFFLSLYLLPLIMLPFRLKKERNSA